MARKRRLGDRYDGRLLRTLDPFCKIIPYIMRTRTSSQNFYSDAIEISRAEAYVRRKRLEGLKDFKFLYLVVAAFVRVISQKPAVNRFIIGKKVYAHNDITMSMAVKRKMSADSTETTIKVSFDPRDTIYDVYSKMNKTILENKTELESNETDKTADIVMKIPRFIVDFFVWLLGRLDRIGLFPKIFNKVSPFHASFFMVDLGSLGVLPGFHHLYEFGTCSGFVVIGAKRKVRELSKDGSIIERKVIDFSMTIDERITDGFYFVSALNLFKHYMQHPELLESPPETVVEDID